MHIQPTQDDLHRIQRRIARNMAHHAPSPEQIRDVLTVLREDLENPEQSITSIDRVRGILGLTQDCPAVQAITGALLAASASETPPSAPANIYDAAEMLWIVLANVSGGDWTKQSKEWQEAAARWRDYYFTAISVHPAVTPLTASEPTSTAPAPPYGFFRSLESGLLTILSFMGEGVHGSRCNRDEDGPCDCGFIEPREVAEALLLQVQQERLQAAAPSRERPGVQRDPEREDQLARWHHGLPPTDPSRERSAAPPSEPEKPCADGHVWSNQFGDDWTPEVGTLCDCRQKAWGVSTPPAPAPPTPQPTKFHLCKVESETDMCIFAEGHDGPHSWITVSAVAPAPEGATATTPARAEEKL